MEDTAEKAPRLEKIPATTFLAEVERCAKNAEMLKTAVDTEQSSYEFDEVKIVLRGETIFEFKSAAYTQDVDGRFVTIGTRGHGRDEKDLNLAAVGGTIDKRIDLSIEALEDPATTIEVKRRKADARQTW